MKLMKEEQISPDAFLKEAKYIVDKAEGKGITLRVMGGVGIALHSSNHREFAKRLGRLGKGEKQEFSDLDFMAYKKQFTKIMRFFVEDLDYIERKRTLSTALSLRQIFFNPEGWCYADVFFDKLVVANHTIDFRRRLIVDSPTVSITDLLLEKIQMWEAFSQKDLKDCLVLVRAHDVGEGNGETINAKYVAELLSDDWGFWYTATTNLNRIREFMNRLNELGPKAEIDPSAITEEEKIDIINKIDTLLNYVEKEDKSLKWKMRSKVGTLKRWYRHVETPETVAGFGIWRMKELYPEKRKK